MNNTNMQLSKIVFAIALSSAVTVLPYEQQNLVPRDTVEFSAGLESAMTWQENYQYETESESQIEILNNFARKLVSNSEDMDPEFHATLSNNLWDLI